MLLPDGAASGHRQQPAGPSTVQDGYADLLAGLGTHVTPAAAPAPPIANASEQASAFPKQAVSHSRRVSWDDSIFDGPNTAAAAASAVQHPGGLPWSAFIESVVFIKIGH